jgi:hypothetical protein
VFLSTFTLAPFFLLAKSSAAVISQVLPLRSTVMTAFLSLWSPALQMPARFGSLDHRPSYFCPPPTSLRQSSCTDSRVKEEALGN